MAVDLSNRELSVAAGILRLQWLTWIDVKQVNPVGSSGEESDRVVTISRRDAHEMVPQETGVVDNQNKALVPATRSHYVPEQWALTVPGAQAPEILSNPEANNRKRRRYAPAFIKPSLTSQRLSSLITILHAIPIAREALLNRKHVLPDYGREKDWWDGTTVKLLRLVNVDCNGQHTDEDEILYECQRLMAFLDETDRAYGSTDVLAGLRGLSGYDSDKVLKFYGTWHSATAHALNEAPLASIFESKGTKRNKSDPKLTQSESFWCLNPVIDNELCDYGLTLYDVVDQLLWEDSNEDEEVYFEELAEVMTMEVVNKRIEVPGLGIDVPTVLCLDRYMPSATEQAEEMRNRKATVIAGLKSNQAARSLIVQAKNAFDDTELNATQLIAKATTYFEKTALQVQTGGISQDNERMSGLAAKIAGDLRALSERISLKLQGMCPRCLHGK